MIHLKLIVLSLSLLLASCSTRYVPIKVPCGPDPEMRPVIVKDKTISNEQVDNVIDNHMSLWKRVHELKKLGCSE